MFFEDAIIDQFLDRRNATAIQGALGSAVSSMGKHPWRPFRFISSNLGDIFFSARCKAEALKNLAIGGGRRVLRRGRLWAGALPITCKSRRPSALLYDVLGFHKSICRMRVSNSRLSKSSWRYQTASQLGELLRKLRAEDRRS